MALLNIHNPFPKPPPNASGNLTILQNAADAYQLWHSLLLHIPRLTRYTLGVNIDTLFIETVELILQAGYSHREQKLEIVLHACTKLDALKFFLQISWELKALDTKRYARISEPLTEVGRMLGGWKNNCKQLPCPDEGEDPEETCERRGNGSPDSSDCRSNSSSGSYRQR